MILSVTFQVLHRQYYTNTHTHTIQETQESETINSTVCSVGLEGVTMKAGMNVSKAYDISLTDNKQTRNEEKECSHYL
jgi:hypothetical protein